METLKKIKDLVEKMSVDTHKVYEKGNRSASIRARKYAQEIKQLIGVSEPITVSNTERVFLYLAVAYIITSLINLFIN